MLIDCNNTNINKEEISLYDRQLRIIGTDTQLKLKTSNILLINLSGIGSEILKNLILGGVKFFTILDDSKVQEDDFSTQFFLPKDDNIIDKIKLSLVVDNIKKLNKNLKIKININSLETFLKDDECLNSFDLVIGTELSKKNIIKLNKKTRQLNVPLYVTGSHGTFGYVLVDLIKNISKCEKNIGNQKRKKGDIIGSSKKIIDIKVDEKQNKEILTISDEYFEIESMFQSKKIVGQLNKREFKNISQALPLIFTLFKFEKLQDVDEYINLDVLKALTEESKQDLGISHIEITDEYLEHFKNQAFTEFILTASILGGVVSQDVIHFFSKKESTINNCLIFDSLNCSMQILAL